MSGRKRALITSAVDNAVIKEKRPRSSNDSPCNIPIYNEKSRRAGTIVRITLKNFMCHSHLEVNLKNNINYIIGRNGSGKSAILTALVVGLGGKASLTNRGTAVNRFVKAGQTSASVEIVLNNTGPDAYKRSIYGNEIIIQRNFSVKGNSAYKIKSSTGSQVIAKSSKEIQQILTSLNIQIDNPVCILNQDTSRNFLSTSDAKQKFILFMRATRLETLDLNYKSILADKKEISRRYKEKEQICQELKNQRKELETKIANFKGIAELKKQLTFLNAELSWAKVRDIENEYSEHEAAVERLLAQCNQYEDYRKNKSQRLVEIKQKTNELQQQIAELKEAAEVQNRPQLDLQNEIDGLRQSYREKRQRKQHLVKQMQEKNQNIEALNVEINNFTAKLDNVEQEKLAKKKEISDLEVQIGQIVNMIETTQNDIFQLNNSINRQEEQENDLQRESRQIKTRHDQITDQIESLKNETNSLVVYGKEMPEIVKAIRQNENRFTHLPRGPLGAFINIKDKKWVVAIEGFLGTGLLRAFTVDNKKDNTLLMEIFNRHCGSGQKPMVITSKFFNKVHDIKSNSVQADKDCISLYDAIDIKDSVVANCLIDQMSIETILLIPSTERAIELLSDQNRVPQNCSQGVTIKGDKFYPDPNYKTYASRYHRARYLQVDTKDLIRGHEEALVELAAKLKNIQAQINAVVLDKSKQKHDLIELKKKFETLRKTNFVAKRKLENLRITEDSESINVQALENEVSDLKSIIQRLTAECGNIDKEMEGIKGQINNAEERLNELIRTGKEFEDRIAPLEQQVREHSKKEQELDVSSTFEKNRLQGLQDKLALARSEMLSKQNELDRLTEQAVAVGERIEELR